MLVSLAMTKKSLNPRQEMFVQHLLEGRTQKDAYSKAGYSASGNSAEVAAARLFRNVQVAARVAELQARAARRSEVTVDSLVQELDEILQLATKLGQPAAGVGAIMGKAKLLGLIVDRAEVSAVVRKPSRTPTTDKSISMEDWVKTFAPRRVN